MNSIWIWFWPSSFNFHGQNSIINEPEFNLIKEKFWKFHQWSHRWFCNKSWETDKKGPKWTTTVKTKHQRIHDSWTIWVQIEFLILKSALWPINNLTPITIWIKFDIIKTMFTWKLILDGVKNLVMTLSNKAGFCSVIMFFNGTRLWPILYNIFSWRNILICGSQQASTDGH